MRGGQNIVRIRDGNECGHSGQLEAVPPLEGGHGKQRDCETPDAANDLLPQLGWFGFEKSFESRVDYSPLLA